MADLHNYFLKFNNSLNIPSSKNSRVKRSERNIKSYITKFFDANHPDLNFQMVRQGSLSLNTMIRTKEDTCDVDFGLRFFPMPKHLQPITLQNYVKLALTTVNNSTYPIHKKKCIRLVYKGDYHVDVTVYGVKSFSSSLKLATKEGWEDSDPSKFKKWFEEKGENNLEQLKRIVKYLKAWSNYKGSNILKGITITVLAAQNFKPSKRDDISLYNTTCKIFESLQINLECPMPVSPYDDLIENISLTKTEVLHSRLKSLIRDAEKAILKQTKDSEAFRLWKKHLGKYFINK